jgi:hypothetical protein
MKKLLLPILSFALIISLAGCGGNDEGNGDNGEDTSSSGEIGIAACDEYIEKSQACFNSSDQVSEEQKEAVEQAFDATVDGWKAMAENSDQKASLETACQSALDSIEQSMGALGCEF